MRKILILLVFISFSSCQDDKKTANTPEYIISPDPSLVLKFGGYSSWQEALKNQSFISKYNANPIVKYWSLEDFTSIVDIPDEAILSLSALGSNKLVKTLSFEGKKDITFKVESKQSYNYDNISIASFQVTNGDIYYSHLGGKAVFCSSKIILENIIRNYQNGFENPDSIIKLLNVLSDQSPSLVINNASFSKIINQFFDENILKTQMNLSEYSGFDINVDDDKILLSGIIFNPKNEDKPWTKFKNVNPQKSTAVEVIPTNFKNLKSILFSDFEQLSKTPETVEQKPKTDSLYINIREIASVKLNKGTAIVLVSNNVDQTIEYIKKKSIPQKTIGDNIIYKLNQEIVFGENFSTIIDKLKVEFFTVYKEELIFSNALETIENIIIQINNHNLVANQANYNNHLESLNSESHILWLTNLANQDSFLDEHAQDTYKEAFKTIKWSNHELLMSQLIVEDDFGYFNILQKKTIENQKKTQIEQVVRLKSENGIVNTPAFFKNWRTGQHDVVYQNDQNILHLKDTKGNLIWTKKLNDPIIGKISSIDIYQNSRIQMAFVTKNKLYIIDKNGDDVKPFPLKIKEDITQGLSVFDYSKDGKYRFTLVKSDKTEMYDKEGKRVKGFDFKKTKTPLIFPLKHIRIGSKDYILAQEENGELHILDRRGNTRIGLDKGLKNSENEWFEHQKQFVSINSKGEVLKIDQNGNLNRKDRDLINPKFTANEENLVILSENKIYINSNETELPYGLYTDPSINNSYIGIADKQAQKIYILNKNAKLIEGFPVYGSKLADFYSNENELVLLCEDSNNALLVYWVEFR